MEWYYIVVMLAAFVAIIGVLIYLGKRGIVTSETIASIRALISGLSDMVGMYANCTDNSTARGMDKAIELLEQAVLAAENMWYNGQIAAEERYEVCIGIFNDLLATYEIALPDGFGCVIDHLIAAACEALGHMRMTKAALEAQHGVQ